MIGQIASNELLALVGMFGAGSAAGLGGRYLYYHRWDNDRNGNGKSMRTLLSEMERRLMERHDRTERSVAELGTVVARHDERISALTERTRAQ